MMTFPRTSKRYFDLGVVSCSVGGLFFSIGVILVVIGSSPQEPEALWITGIVLLLFGGMLFFLGIGSIGLYLAMEDKRRKTEARNADRQYAASLKGSSELIIAEKP